MSYPVTYRKGAQRYSTPQGNSAFRELQRRPTLSDFEKLLQRTRARPSELGKERFLQSRDPFGRRTNAQDMLLRYAERNLRKRFLRKFSPLTGELDLLLTAGQLFVDALTNKVVYPDAKFVPDYPGSPDRWDFPGWRHDGPIVLSSYGYYTLVSVDGQVYSRAEYGPGLGQIDNVAPSMPILPDSYHASRLELATYQHTLFGNSQDWYVTEAWHRGEDDPEAVHEPATEPVPAHWDLGEPVVETSVQPTPLDDGPAEVVPSIVPGFGREVGHDVSPRDIRNPFNVPAVVTVITPHTQTTRVGEHELDEPPPRTKERKFIASVRAGSLLDRVVGNLTEAADLIEAIHKALPDKYKEGYYLLHRKDGSTFYVKRRESTPQQKLRELYAHWDEVDLHDAIENVALNEMQDTLIGGANQRVTKNARKWYGMSGRPVGWFTGKAL